MSNLAVFVVIPSDVYLPCMTVHYPYSSAYTGDAQPLLVGSKGVQHLLYIE